MIYYVVTRQHSYTVDVFLKHPFGRGLADRIECLFYEDLPGRTTLPFGTYIFSDLDRISPWQVERAVHVWNALSARSGIRLLNHPREALSRYPLLRLMAAERINSFQVYRISDDLSRIRFPVFIREESEHTGSLTNLLQGREDMERALRRLTSPWRGGFRLEELLVVEFCNVADEDGWFRKYTSFNIAGKVLPQTVNTTRQWVVNRDRTHIDEAIVREQKRFLVENPGEEQIREIFARARIDYGRMDFSFQGERLQVWEINTNPTIGPRRKRIIRRGFQPEAMRALVRPRQEVFFGLFNEAMLELDVDGSSEPPVEIPPFCPGEKRLKKESSGGPLTAYRRGVRRLRREQAKSAQRQPPS